MLNGNYQHIGIGIASGWFKDHDTIIVVQMFGKTNKEFNKNSKEVYSSKVEVSGDNLNFETEEVAVSQNTIADRLRNILVSIGSNVSRAFSFAKQVADNSLGWVNNQLLSGYRVFAD
jgi:FtsZ-binding cell division protein ZapB